MNRINTILCLVGITLAISADNLWITALGILMMAPGVIGEINERMI